MALVATITLALASVARGQPRVVRDVPTTTVGVPGEGVTLETMLTYADENSPVLAVARSTRSRADAERVAAHVLLEQNPHLTGAVGPRFGLTNNGLDGDVGLSQQFPVSGERRARIAAAERFTELTDAEIASIRWQVHCDVHATFHRALASRKRLAIAERMLAFQEEVLRYVEGSIRIGETSPLTLRLAQAEVAQARQTVVASRQELLALRILLSQLSGWSVSAPPDPMGELDPPLDPPDQATLVSLARENLPALKALEANVERARAVVTVARREGMPRPSLGVQYRREGNPDPEIPYDVVVATAGLPIPVWQRNQAGRARSSAELLVATTDLASSLRILDATVATARTEMAAAAERVRSYGTEVLPRFEENLTLLRRSFELGEIDVLELSIGRERFLRIQYAAIDAHVDYFLALAALERTVGVEVWPDVHDDSTEGAPR